MGGEGLVIHEYALLLREPSCVVIKLRFLCSHQLSGHEGHSGRVHHHMFSPVFSCAKQPYLHMSLYLLNLKRLECRVTWSLPSSVLGRCSE